MQRYNAGPKQVFSAKWINLRNRLEGKHPVAALPLLLEILSEQKEVRCREFHSNQRVPMRKQMGGHFTLWHVDVAYPLLHAQGLALLYPHVPDPSRVRQWREAKTKHDQITWLSLHGKHGNKKPNNRRQRLTCHDSELPFPSFIFMRLRAATGCSGQHAL